MTEITTTKKCLYALFTPNEQSALDMCELWAIVFEDECQQLLYWKCHVLYLFELL